MKYIKSIAILSILLASKVSYCDIIPDNTTYVGVCVQITNLNDYPNVSLIGFMSNRLYLSSSYSSNIINQNICNNAGSKYGLLSLYAVRSSYISNKSVTSIDWSKDKNAVKSNFINNTYSSYMYNMSTVDSIKQYYKILGFTDTSIVMYEWKEVTKYNNGQADNVVLKSYQGDLSSLSQNIITGSPIVSNKVTFDLYPNPTTKNLHLKICNNFYGNILVKITSTEGKVVKTSSVIKDTSYLDFLLYVDMLRKGNYVVTIIMGEAIESRRLLVE